MKMNKEEFYKLTFEYVNAEKEYFNKLSEYIGASWNNGKLDRPIKILTREALDVLKQLEEKRNKLEKKWKENL